MKYKVTRYQPRPITLSEYCDSAKLSLHVREVQPRIWQANVGNAYGSNSLTINGAIDGLCEALSGPDLKVIPGTDLEAAE
jgi:hypothetical protein